MANTATYAATSRKAIRLSPGVAIVALQWFLWLGVPALANSHEAAYVAVFGALSGGVAVLGWWAFFSRAPGVERWGAVVLSVVSLTVTPKFLHESIATGMMGILFAVYAIPILSLAFVAWAATSRSLPDAPRRLAMAATIAVACGGWTLLRTNGISGAGAADFEWRWSETPEERLLAEARGEAPIVAPAASASAPVEALSARPEVAPVPRAEAPRKVLLGWPGFRGPNRDGVLRGVRIETDWTDSPPIELWRRPVGPGWSSFAVRGELLYTQEQRGDEEIVASYDLASGEPVWRHADEVRFWESNGGAGPRATPTLQDGRVYAFGATGILNALDADNGAVAWSRNVSADAETSVPGWGFAGSPLVFGEIVFVAASGKLAAYDLETGNPRWFGPDGGSGYSSPQLAAINGIAQVLLVSKSGAAGFAPDDGAILWEYLWPPKTRIVQPVVTAEGDLFLSGGESTGLRRIALVHESDGWTANERWTSFRLKPYFNDFVVHEGHAYGFDGAILTCIDLEDGERKWKGGRYGQGQMLLLADQDVLLVLSEEGNLALVSADPQGFRELAQVPAIQGKTWNHPVLVGDVLLVRNGEEMAAFRLALAGR